MQDKCKTWSQEHAARVQWEKGSAADDCGEGKSPSWHPQPGHACTSPEMKPAHAEPAPVSLHQQHTEP